MNEETLKNMWNRTGTLGAGSVYNSQLIQKYLTGRSIDTSHKIRNMIRFDILVKALLIILLAVDIFLYAGTSKVVTVCILGIAALLSVIWFELKMNSRFDAAADQGQNTREKLSSMLSYLKTKFTSTLLAISITYLFLFIGGSLIYFYMAYGYVRTLDTVDVIVFSGFILMGILINFFVNKGQVKYQVKHLENCLSDLNDQALPLAEELIEAQRKQDRSNKLFLAVVLIIAFLMLIAVFLNFSGMK